jgi:iron complex outermembrane receptor protein
MPRLTATVCALAGLLLYDPALAASEGDGQSLADFSLEELSRITVHSVSRQATRLAEAPAAVYLISGDDIRHAGATTLPEALRLAPNLQIADLGGQGYAITARGLSSRLENKLLVMIDGRSVYSPLFSGVYWDMQDVLMEDIERIEVISGPGSTMWGANAVNGIINIITKPAGATQGAFASATLGARGRQGALRYGGRLDNGAAYRVYGQHSDGEGAGRVDWHRVQTGFRLDLDGPGGMASALSGDAYTGQVGERTGAGIVIAGANLLARTQTRLAGGTDLRLQAYLDHTERDEPGLGAQRLNTLDLDAQLGIPLDPANQLAVGGGLRVSHDRIDNRGLVFLPTHRTLRWANLFAQDEITLAPGLRLIGGVKFEHNSYTGLETLPGVRLAWSPASDILLWSAVSRTVRAPSRLERDLAMPRRAATVAGAGALANIMDASDDFVSETARVLELGYRVQPAVGLSWSATLFFSDYDRLRSFEPGTGASGGATFQNLGNATTRGLELASRWQVSPVWRLDAGAVLQRVKAGVAAESGDVLTAGTAADPSHYWTVRAAHTLSERLHADAALRHVGRLGVAAVPSYTELDVRLAWQVSPQLELALTGRNLLHAEHMEYGSNPAGVQAGLRQSVPRSVYATANVHF